jgi:hypothetical protein
MELGLNFDTIGEDLACRAVAVSNISSADGDADGPEDKEFDILVSSTKAAVIEASVDGRLLAALQEDGNSILDLEPSNVSQTAVSEASRQKAREDIVAAAKDGLLTASLVARGDSKAEELRPLVRQLLRSVYTIASQDAAVATGTAVGDAISIGQPTDEIPVARVPPAESLSDQAPWQAQEELPWEEQEEAPQVFYKKEDEAAGFPEADASESRPGSRERARKQLLEAAANGRLRDALSKQKQTTPNGAAGAEADALPAGAEGAVPDAVELLPPQEEPNAVSGAVADTLAEVSSPPEDPGQNTDAVGDALPSQEEPGVVVAATVAVPEVSKWAPPAERPCLYYFPFAGRGELIRLIAAVGGLQMDEKGELEDCSPFGSPGCLPCFEHGDLQISQSFAVEMYIASITPLFASLTPAQQAIDSHFCKMKEDMLKGFSDLMMELTPDIMSNDRQKETLLRNIELMVDTWYPLVEEKLPMDGFVLGLSTPTVADLAVIIMQKAFMPFGAMCEIGSHNLVAKFPKFAAHVARVAEYPPVKVYLESSTTMTADPFGLQSVRLTAAAEAPVSDAAPVAVVAGPETAPEAPAEAAAEADPVAEIALEEPATQELTAEPPVVVDGETEAVVDEAGYLRHPSWVESATSLGRAQQTWAERTLDSLAKETPVAGKRKRKPGLKRLSSTSILRSLGYEGFVPLLQGSKSSPSIGANSVLGQQSSNSIRSQLTSPADSDWMVRSTWTPPSPPAPSSARTEKTVGSVTDRSLQLVPSLPSMPATGLRLSPCNSATSQKAKAANLARSEVPGIDFSRVHMDADDDDDTEDYPTGGPGQAYANSMMASDGQPSGESQKANVPQLDMSSLQMDSIGGSNPGKNSHSGGSRQVAPRDSNPADGLRPASRGASLPPGGFESPDQVKPGSHGAQLGSLRPVVPGPREMQAAGTAYPPTYSSATSTPGYVPTHQDFQYGFTVDVAGSVLAGGEKKLALNAPVGVRLPPVNKGPRGKKPGPVSHVHWHHHLHYHVNRPAAESDLPLGPP